MTKQSPRKKREPVHTGPLIEACLRNPGMFSKLTLDEARPIAADFRARQADAIRARVARKALIERTRGTNA